MSVVLGRLPAWDPVVRMPGKVSGVLLTAFLLHKQIRSLAPATGTPWSMTARHAHAGPGRR